MNGKAAQLERWLEAIRQRSATNALGQVTCTYGLHDHQVMWDGCYGCGAAV